MTSEPAWENNLHTMFVIVWDRDTRTYWRVHSVTLVVCWLQWCSIVWKKPGSEFLFFVGPLFPIHMPQWKTNRKLFQKIPTQKNKTKTGARASDYERPRFTCSGKMVQTTTRKKWLWRIGTHLRTRNELTCTHKILPYSDSLGHTIWSHLYTHDSFCVWKAMM